MPVLNRAELSRTGVIFVALLLAICATGAAAREFRAADTQTEDYPTVQALRYMGALIDGVAIVREIDGEPFEDAMAAIYAKAERNPATATLIERIRKAE